MNDARPALPPVADRPIIVQKYGGSSLATPEKVQAVARRIAETVAWANWKISEEAWRELLSLPFSWDDPEATRVYTPG